MTELERRLLELGAALEVPATPDVMVAVRERLAARPARARQLTWFRRPRRLAIVAISLVVLLAGTAAAVPAIRHGIERLLGLRGAVVERVPQLPQLPPGAGRRLNLGDRIPVARARQAASFQALLPPRGVDAAYVSRDIAGGRISLTVGRSLVIEFRGQASPFILKLAGPGTRARRVRVAGGPGIFLDQAPHEVFFLDAHGSGQSDAVRLAGSVLLWQHGPLILRIEGRSSLPKALALARSLR
jgi:hypothetical protein